MCAHTPSLMVTYRCVKSDERPFAAGLQFVFFRTLGKFKYLTRDILKTQNFNIKINIMFRGVILEEFFFESKFSNIVL